MTTFTVASMMVKLHCQLICRMLAVIVERHLNEDEIKVEIQYSDIHLKLKKGSFFVDTFLHLWGIDNYPDTEVFILTFHCRIICRQVFAQNNQSTKKRFIT